MLQRFISVFMAILAFFTSLSQLIFTPNVIRIDFDRIVDEIRPVHNVGRMPEYETGSEIDRYFTEANMTSCRTHDIHATDIHNIFPDPSADVNDEGAYFFEDCDKVIAAIIDTGMEPFFRLGISWSDPIRDREFLLPPADYEKWAEVCEHIILHYNEGWADGFQYDIEYWEIWNEPENSDDIADNHFWIGSDEEFFRLYDVSAKYLKKRFPELKIGGYGSCGFYALTKTNAINTGATPRNQYFVTYYQNFLSYIREHGSPMDFFSWHSYTTTGKNASYIKYVKETLSKAGYGDAEIICDEWNYNPTENDKLDRRYGANQTSMLLMFQNEGLDMAHYYNGDDDGSLWSGLFVDRQPSTAYYGFRAFGQLYRLGHQAQIKNMRLADDLYAVAATGEEGQALLISNVSEKKDRPLKIDAGEYAVDKCMTVNENGEWVEIPLPEKIESGSMLYITFMKNKFDRSYFANARVGLFTHYTYATYAQDKGTNWGGTWFSRDDSRSAASPEEAAAMFDGEAYARTAYDMGAEYVVFTLAHAGFNLLFPSETMKAVCPQKCTETSDVVAKVIEGLAPYGIPLVLYLPPNDAHDISEEELRQMGWTDDEARMEFLKKLIRELYERYGRGISGFWFDQGGPTKDVCDVVRECDPDAVIFVNTGVTANTKKHPLSDLIVSEYYGSIAEGDSDALPTHYSQVNRQIGNWWASGNQAPTGARELYRYTVRTAATKGQSNAGIAWACGPYIDQTWEDGVREALGELGELLRAHEGIYGTVPGKSYVTKPDVPLEKSDWGVSTESPDGKTVWLHVLNLPDDGVLTLPCPADCKRFVKAEYGDLQLEMKKDIKGYRIAMPEDCDPIDTVIRLTAG